FQRPRERRHRARRRGGWAGILNSSVEQAPSPAAGAGEDRAVFPLVIPVHKGELNIPPRRESLDDYAGRHDHEFALPRVFLIDGSPDSAYWVRPGLLRKYRAVRSQVHNLSRNFGAAFAVRRGLEQATGDYFAPVAADLQEPFASIPEMFQQVRDGAADV